MPAGPAPRSTTPGGNPWGRRWNDRWPDRTSRQRDLDDGVGPGLGYPECSSWSGGNAFWVASRRGQGKLPDVPVGTDPGHKAVLFGEPDVAVRAGREIADPPVG